MKKTMLLAAALLGMMSATGVLAATVADMDVPQEPPRKDLSWTVGLGVASVPEYEGSEDYMAAPVPLVSVVSKNGMSADLLGNVLRANIIPDNTWRFGPELRYRAERKDVKNDRVDAMKDIDGATELGAFAGFDMNNWSVKVDVTHDTSGVYNGTLGGLSLGYSWVAAPWKFTLSGSTSIADNKYMTKYFGVDAEDAVRSGLKKYSIGGGVKDVGATFVAGYRINQNWGVTGAIRYTRIIGDAADSPIVDDEGSAGQMLIGLLATYTF